MRFKLQHDPPLILIEDIGDADAAVLANGFGIRSEGDSVTLVRGDILGPKDSDGNRPTLGFVLQGLPHKDQTRITIVEEGG